MSKGGTVYWKCLCDCGNTRTFNGSSLRAGKATHCGCSRPYSSKDPKRDGRSKTRLYRIWQGMKSRCACMNDGDYPNYGERGIRVCSEWQESFEAFRDWAYLNGYGPTLTIDRQDVNGMYSPDNCKWSTVQEQQRNKRNTLYITWEGVTQAAPDWAEQLGVSVYVIHSRYRRTGTPFTAKQLQR